MIQISFIPIFIYILFHSFAQILFFFDTCGQKKTDAISFKLENVRVIKIVAEAEWILILWPILFLEIAVKSRTCCSKENEEKT